MAKKSIGQLHAEVTANATQFVNEFKRADNAARRHGAEIRKEVEKIGNDVARDFAPGKLVKGFLGGLGIGGGIELARTGIEKFKELLDAPTEQAKEMSEYVEKMREDLRAIHDFQFEIALGRAAPGEKPEMFSNEISEQRRILLEAERAREQARADLRRAGEDDFQAGSAEGLALKGKYKLGTFDMGGAIMKAAQAEIDKQQAIAEAQKKKVLPLEDRHGEAVDDVGKRLESGLAEMKKVLADDEKETAQKEAELAKKREELMRAVQTPVEKLRSQNGEAWAAFDDGTIDAEMRDRLIKKAESDFASASKVDMGRWDKAGGTLKADDMTRRGLGTGADYATPNTQREQLLGDILTTLQNVLEAIKEANRNHPLATMSD